MTALAHTLVAFNTATASENKMHDDTVAVLAAPVRAAATNTPAVRAIRLNELRLDGKFGFMAVPPRE